MTTHRERVIAAFSHQVPDRVPRYLHLSPALEEALQEALGTEDLVAALDLDVTLDKTVGRGPSSLETDFSQYFDEIPPEADYSEWGEMWYPAGFYHFQGQKKPMASFTSVQEIEDYPFPDIHAAHRYAEVPAQVAAVQAEGYPAVSAYDPGFFETAHGIRGMQDILADLLIHPDFAHALLERITVRNIGAAVQYAKAGVDILLIGDDWGFQKAMVMSLDTWREFFKPLLAKEIKAVREVNADVIIAYHSCGHVEPVVPELIECGIDVLQSVQPEANDPARLKRLYGDRLAFWGTVGVQSTFPFGTPNEIEQVVKERIATVGQGGGLLIGPAHVIEPETPVENVLAFIEAVDKYGTYHV
jgi:uroporphyrinogen decarboxylase